MSLLQLEAIYLYWRYLGLTICSKRREFSVRMIENSNKNVTKSCQVHNAFKCMALIVVSS
jgi:hypothetical protein